MNKQTIDAIMKSARARITSENGVPMTVARMPADEVAALLAEIERLRAKLAEIEAQEPVLWAPSIVAGPEARMISGMEQSLTVWFDRPDTSHPGRGHCQTPLYSSPVPAPKGP